jgi:hypothetical protein
MTLAMNMLGGSTQAAPQLRAITNL